MQSGARVLKWGIEGNRRRALKARLRVWHWHRAIPSSIFCEVAKYVPNTWFVVELNIGEIMFNNAVHLVSNIGLRGRSAMSPHLLTC